MVIIVMTHTPTHTRIYIYIYIYIYIDSVKERDNLEDLDAVDGRTRIEQNLRNSMGIGLVHDTESWQAVVNAAVISVWVTLTAGKFLAS